MYTRVGIRHYEAMERASCMEKVLMLRWYTRKTRRRRMSLRDQYCFQVDTSAHHWQCETVLMTSNGLRGRYMRGVMLKKALKASSPRAEVEIHAKAASWQRRSLDLRVLPFPYLYLGRHILNHSIHQSLCHFIISNHCSHRKHLQNLLKIRRDLFHLERRFTARGKHGGKMFQCMRANR